MEFIIEIFLQIFLELYLGIAEIIVPDKQFKKWQTVLLKVLCIFVLVGSFVLTVVGIIFLVDGSGFVAGVAMTSVGGFIILVNIILFIIVLVHENAFVNSLKSENCAEEEDPEDN